MTIDLCATIVSIREKNLKKCILTVEMVERVETHPSQTCSPTCQQMK